MWIKVALGQFEIFLCSNFIHFLFQENQNFLKCADFYFPQKLQYFGYILVTSKNIVFTDCSWSAEKLEDSSSFARRLSKSDQNLNLVKTKPIPTPGSAAIIYWYSENGRGWLIDWQIKILLDGWIDSDILEW